MATPPTFRDNLRNQILPALFIIVLLVLSAAFTPRWVTFRDFAVADVLRLLTSLFTIALFVERSLEVFINTWRGPDAADLDTAVHNAELLVPSADSGLTMADILKARKIASDNKSRYKSRTQRIALWTGLAVGVVISAIGVRTLETFALTTSLTSLSPIQTTAFRLVDVLLTGGLIAGGSEGIHKLTQVYTSFMDASAKRAANAGDDKATVTEVTVSN